MPWRVQIDDDIYKDVTGSSGSSIPEVSTDPVSPNAQDAWVLKSGGTTGGGVITAFIGGFPLLTAGSGSSTYQFSYYTNEGTIVRTTLS